MQRIGATIALLGYLWGGLLLPTVHRHVPHDSAHAPSGASSACEAAVQGCAHDHSTATATSIAQAAGGWQGLAPSAHACQELCLLCQLASTSYIACSGKGSFFGAVHASPARPSLRQLPPPSQRRTAGYLRGPPLCVS